MTLLFWLSLKTSCRRKLLGPSWSSSLAGETSPDAPEAPRCTERELGMVFNDPGETLFFRCFVGTTCWPLLFVGLFEGWTTFTSHPKEPPKRVRVFSCGPKDTLQRRLAQNFDPKRFKILPLHSQARWSFKEAKSLGGGTKNIPKPWKNRGFHGFHPPNWGFE